MHAFDRFQEYGTEIPTLNILNAIDWVAESWRNMTEDVIYRCWERTDILPDESEVINDEPPDNEIETENEIVQSLIDQMVVDDTVVRAKDYIEIDNTLETADMLNDDEIIAAVQEAPEDEGEDDDKNEVFIVSNKVALESIQNIHNYLQQNNDIKVNSLFVSELRDLKWKIDKKRIDSSTQMSIDTYFQ